MKIKTVTVNRGSWSYEVSFNGTAPMSVTRVAPQGSAMMRSSIWSNGSPQTSEAVMAIALASSLLARG